MKAAIWGFVGVFTLLSGAEVYGQGMRGGSFGSARGGATGMQQAVSPSGQGGAVQQRSTLSAAPAPRVGAPVQHTVIPHSPIVVRPGPVVKGPVISGPPLVGTPLPALGWGPGLRWRGRPPFVHHPPHFHRHPGVVFYDYPVTTVVTQVAPGVVQQERRYVEDPAPEVSSRNPGSLAPFDPTPQEIVERMLALAGVKKGDVVYDLGAGDGRIVIAAAKKYGVRAVGFETDPGLAKLARENARNAGVEKLVEIREQDFLSADLSRASVVMLYLSYDGNLAVRDQLHAQLRPGARVVSYTFDMGDWPAKIAESYRDKGGNAHALYLWEITAASLARQDYQPMLQPQPNRGGPLIIEVR
jgi:precorrin-6B methylase 2